MGAARGVGSRGAGRYLGRKGPEVGGRRGAGVLRRSNTYDEMFASETDYGAYLAMGVSTCFRKDEEGKLSEIDVIEPINATSLETMSIGAATSFKYVTGVTLGDVVDMDSAQPSFPRTTKPLSFARTLSIAASFALAPGAVPT